MLYFYLLAWWAVGFAATIWLARSEDMTWGQLVACAGVGFLGPAIALVVGFVVVTQLEFWSQPIFKRDRK